MSIARSTRGLDKSESGKRKSLVLIDAHAVLHRAYHALPQFSNSRGEPTGGLYGLAAMLIKIIAAFRPDYIAAAYDLPKPTFRHEAYKAYKAGRAKADDALISQMKRSREIFSAFNIPIYDKEGFEADDILGTIVEQLKIENGKLKIPECDVVIASGDMDTLQLVDDKHVQVFTLKKGINDTVLYDEEAVKQRYGFGPEFLPDFKGLKGDPSDNIKGVKGIGDKTATELIKNFGTIENIYRDLETRHSKLKTSFTPRVVELLEKGKEDAEFSKILGTIRRDAPITFSFPEKTWGEGVEMSKAEALFQELEFRQLAERLRGAVGKVNGGNGEDKSTSAKKAAAGGEKQERRPTQASLGDALSSSDTPPREMKETSVALWLINSTLANPTLEDIFAFAGTRDFREAKKVIFAELQARRLTRVFEEIERPLIPVIEKMNERGVLIDVTFLRTLSREYHKELTAREKEIWKLAGAEFNVNSPKQLGDILFRKMGLRPAKQKKTPTGALSTRESELEKMRGENPIIENILEHREFQKLLSTYIDNLPEMAGKDGRLHANFLQAGAVTGRMASENPNLQNIPMHTPVGRRIREAFVAEKGSALLSLDYSQIELRIAAFMSKDPKFIEIFEEGLDVHSAVAAEVFDVPLSKVDKDMRRKAKVINFGILYGMGVNSLRGALAKGGLPVSREEAARFLEHYFARFSTLASYLEETKNRARKDGFTETLFGRRRNFEALNSSIPYIRAAAERQAANAPLQGTGADLIKLAMVRADEFLQKEKLDDKAHLILQVHDELVYEVEEGLIQEIAPKIKKIMESVLTSKETKGIPLVADASVGKSWGDLKKLVDSS
ncbi:MAG: DNA polymerase [Patescibacteria group bacterium]